MIRAWVEAQCEKPSGWLAAIRNPNIGRALAAIHRRPGDQWSVKSLAEIALRITVDVLGALHVHLSACLPARYLARWRMHMASGWLRNERLSVAEVAARLGYESEASIQPRLQALCRCTASALRRTDASSQNVGAQPSEQVRSMPSRK